MTPTPAEFALPALRARRRGGAIAHVRRHPTIAIGAGLLIAMALMAVLAPYLGTTDPQALAPARRLHWPSSQNWFGTDMLGRDVWSRPVFGARVSLTIGIGVALASCGI